MTPAATIAVSSTPAKLGLLASLYFSQGLPFGFFTQALPVMLRAEGFSLGEIGLSSLLALPWALKFLWAPAVDRFSFGAIGRRKCYAGHFTLATALAAGAVVAAWALFPSAEAVRRIHGRGMEMAHG